ncbi:MAG: hypothetical protein RIS44_1494 [Pseudomonadota bacterium]
MKTKTFALSYTLAALTMMLTACGGSDSGTDVAAAPSPAAPAPAPAPAANPVATLTGTVMVNEAVRNAVVCMDLNANNTCDTGEPTAAKTGADGAYSLTYNNTQITAAQVAAASLIAPMVPGPDNDPNTTIDTADGGAVTAKPYVLKQVPGKAGQINPLTSLVSAGIAAGMSEATARSNVAVQLAIAASKVDNYQDDPVERPGDGVDVMLDTARTAAQVTSDLMEGGGTLVVGDQTAAIAASSPGALRSLNYTDAGNYLVRTRPTLAKAAGVAGQTTVDVRAGKTAGADTPASTLYNFANLTSTGWVRCDASTATPGTVGNPNRSFDCNGSALYLGHSVFTSVAGRSMSTVVTEQRADTATNVFNNGVATTGLLSALGGASFPADSSITRRFNLQLTRPIFINSINTDGRPQSEATTLEQLIAAKPASAVNLSTGGGTLSLGISSSNLRTQRVAFTGTTSATAGTVQFYDCDLNAAQTVVSNCTTTTTGTYAISTVNGVRVMRFTGHPVTTMNHVRLYVEVQNAPTVVSGNWVYQARELKPEVDFNLSTNNRLNETAWVAMKAQLGI